MPSHPAVVSPESFHAFGDLLRFLRKRAELKQRELALQVGYHYSYMSRIEAGERIPDRATILARFIPALHLQDQPAWANRLVELAGQETPAEGAVPLQPAVGETDPREAPPAALPRPATPLLGREAEIRAIGELLALRETRLVSLLGPPGVGKTRLALETGARLAAQFAGGAAFVDLSPVREPERLAGSLVTALGLAESGSRSPGQVLKTALAPKEMLLVLDNFEQIIAAAAFVADLLAAAPGLKILATSRENLRIAAETEYRVPPLPVGADSPAVRLFIDRARRARPDLEFAGDELQAVEALCARLDGLPLAIELAAARVKMLEPRAMLARLDRRLEWLSGGRRDDRPDRASLRQALDWSYELCSPAEQTLFDRLGVFSGGFGLEAVEAVGGEGGDIVETVAGLVDKSLVVPAAGGESEPRFTLLETVREYALDHLGIDPSVLEQTRRSHARFFLRWIRNVSTGKPPSAGWLSSVAGEYDNLRLALGWLLENESEAGLQLADALRMYWVERSLFHEALPWLEAALALAVGSLAHPWRMRFAEMVGLAHWNSGDLALARRYLLEGLELARAVPPEGDPEMIAASLAMLGRLEFNAADRSPAQGLLEEALEIARGAGLFAQQVRILRFLSMHFINEKMLDDADRALDEAIALAQAHGEASNLPPLFNMKGIVAMDRGDHLRAREALSEALYLFRAHPNPRGEAVAHQKLGLIDLHDGQPARARIYLEAALQIARRFGFKAMVAGTLDYLWMAAVAENDLSTARRHLMEELQLALEIDNVRHGLDALGGLGVVRLRMGEIREALERFDFVLRSPAVRGDTVAILRPFVEEARALLPVGQELPPLQPSEDWRRAAYIELAQQPLTGE